MNWILFAKIVLWPLVLFVSYVWLVWFLHEIRLKQNDTSKMVGVSILTITAFIDLVLIALLIALYNPS